MKLTLPFLFILVTLFTLPAFGGDNLRLNPKLDYATDSHDGPLITGDNLQAGLEAGQPNYVIIYGEACFNSKRQARRTVELYEKYKGRVGFVIVDLDQKHSPEQQKLINQYFGGYIPHVVVFDKRGRAIYNSSGEVSSEKISQLLDQALQ